MSIPGEFFPNRKELYVTNTTAREFIQDQWYLQRNENWIAKQFLTCLFLLLFNVLLVLSTYSKAS